MTKVVEDRGDVHVQVRCDDGGGAVEVHKGEDMARGDEVDDDVHIPADDGGGTVHVHTQDNEGDVMAKHIGNESDDQVLVEEGGRELTKMLDKLEVTLAREEAEEEVLMAKEKYLAHGGEGGIAKSTLRFPVSRERRLAQPTL